MTDRFERGMATIKEIYGDFGLVNVTGDKSRRDQMAHSALGDGAWVILSSGGFGNSPCHSERSDSEVKNPPGGP